MSKTKKIILTLAIALVVIGAAAYLCFRMYAYEAYSGSEKVTVVIPKDASETQIADTLKTSMGAFGEKVYSLWSLRHGKAAKAAGVYFFNPGEKAWDIAGQIKLGRSSIQKITFNNVRFMPDMAKKVAKNFSWSEDDFLAACDSILPGAGFKKEEYQAAFIPDTYQVFASAEPADVVNKLLEYRNKFWNEERTAKAKKLGLTPVEVATVASIVEEESHNAAEQPTIARLYLNRIHKGMRLQADPTVKFALGDFTIKRILNRHLTIDSPYNTYENEGLPPGPIRMPERQTLEFVLDAPENDYLYMCAKPQLDGTHNFTSSDAEHLRNARAYQAALDSLKIKR